MAEANAVAIQLDGKIVAAGSTDNDDGTSDFALARYHPDGSLDANFGDDGQVITSISSSFDYATDLALQANGKIIAAGNSDNTESNNLDFALARYDENGNLDTTFDSDGKVTTNVGGHGDLAAIALQPNNRIVAAGSSFNWNGCDFALVRYRSNGSLDTTFDSDGWVTTDFDGDFDAATAVALYADGRIMAGGLVKAPMAVVLLWLATIVTAVWTRPSMAMVELLPALLTMSVLPGQSSSNAVQADGKIVAAGSTDNGATSDFALARYNSDGTLDSTFDEDGRVITDFDGSGQATAIALQADGKIVVVGYGEVINLNRSGFIVARYRSDGSLDSTFGDGGVVITPINNNNDEAHAVALQPNGQIVVAGQSNDDFAVVRYRGDGAALTLSKTANVTTAQVGQTITYTYRVTNTGSIALTGLTANDDKLGQVSLGQTDLALNESTSGVLTYTVLAGDRPGPLVNTVIAGGAPPGGSVVTATATISVAVQPDLTQTTTMYLPSILK